MAWYETWFKKEYLSLYAHRDQREAEQQVSFLIEKLSELPWVHGHNVLDVACGTGRHAREFARQGWRVWGIDLSEELLSEAKKELAGTAPEVRDRLTLLHGDMRSLPFEDGYFSLLSNFFTGFGYFDTDSEHQSLLCEWARVLHQDAALFMDYLNRDYVIAHLEDRTDSENSEYLFQQRREIIDKGRRVRKQISITEKKSGRKQSFEESVRMYSLDELTSLLKNAGLDMVRTWGDFTGADFSPAAPRLVVLAQREGLERSV